MSSILLNEFLTRFVTGLLAWLVILVLFSLLLKWRWRVLTNKVESGEKDQFHNKRGIKGTSISGKYFKVDLPVYILLNLAGYISATWGFVFLHPTLFSSSTAIQSNLNASFNALSFIPDLVYILYYAAVSFILIEFYWGWKQIFKALSVIRS